MVKPSQSATLRPGEAQSRLLIEYWLAAYVGRAWGRLRGDRRWSRGRAAAACGAVARGNGTTLPAGDLAAAQEFAARMWFVAALACLVVMLGLGVLAEPLPRGSWRDGVADSLLGPGLLAVIALSQMGLISYRRNQTSRCVLRGGQAVAARPSEAHRGLPRRSDFWVMLAIAVVGSALIYYLKTHSSA
jgi:hypothetical protein